MAQLNAGDAGGLRAMASSARRAAETATDTARDEPDEDAQAMLGAVSVGALGLAGIADQLAAWIEENR